MDKQKVRKSKSHSLKTHSRKETHAKRQQQDVKLAVIHDLLETRAKLEMETPAAPETDLPSNHVSFFFCFKTQRMLWSPLNILYK